MPRRFALRSGPSSRAITSTGCWRRMPTAALLRPDANGSPHSPQYGRPRNSILCPENPGRYRCHSLMMNEGYGLKRVRPNDIRAYKVHELGTEQREMVENLRAERD